MQSASLTYEAATGNALFPFPRLSGCLGLEDARGKQSFEPVNSPVRVPGWSLARSERWTGVRDHDEEFCALGS